jgi:hypothetical protein
VISAAFLRNFILIPVLMYNQYFGIALLIGINLVYVVAAIRRYYKISFPRTMLMILPTMLLIMSMMLSFWLISALVVLWK